MLELTAEQMLIRDTARELANRELFPRAKEWSDTATFPRAAIDRLKELGFLGMLVPAEWGGTQTGYLAYILAMEEIAAGDASVSTIMAVHNSLVCKLICEYGSQLHKEKALTRLASGEWLGCFALSEASAGSNAAMLKTTAKRTDTGYLLNGSKQFISSGKNADLAIIFALTEPDRGKEGISAFLVPTQSPGYHVTRVEKKMGQHATDTAALSFENLHVPFDHLLGTEGNGYTMAMNNLAAGRIAIAAQAIGIARKALELTITYCQQRVTFGQAIIKHQAVAFDLADMATQLDAARLLTWRAAWLCEQEQPCLQEASMAKLFATEAAQKICELAVQRHGGYGYLDDFPVERLYRDVRVTTIYEGTSDIQRMIISRELNKN
jgi:butyryl-CoA dehydrogenase